VVLIMSDQHNPHLMGCAGNGIVRTPNLDKLAGEGIRLSNVYCPYPLCVPSRSGFMTARYPSEIDVWDNDSILSSSVPTFAHGLGGAGYEAVLCGRMHFRGPDRFHGFEKRIFGELSTGALSPEIQGTGYNRTNGQTKYAVQVSGYGRTGFQLYDQMVTRSACEFIAEPRHDDRPYCLVVGFVLPHNPLIASREWFEYYMERIPVPEATPESYRHALHPAMKMWRMRRGVDDLTPEQNHRGLAAYYALVTELDSNVGQILDAVNRSPECEKTVVIYCSDHGDMACEHGMWWKSNFYEGSAGVPCIVWWPSGFAGGRVMDSVVSLIDIGPTLLEIAGGEALPDSSGKSFAQLLAPEGQSIEWMHEVRSEYMGLLGDAPAYMVRWGPWKLNYYHETGWYQLFNLIEDPREAADRSSDPACKAIAVDCLARMRERWSAEEALTQAKRQHRAMAFIDRCGHEFVPHEMSAFEVPEGYNEFDFGQLDSGR
jgi:choline-sulfatase